MQHIDSVYSIDESYFQKEFSSFPRYRLKQLIDLRKKGFCDLKAYKVLGGDFLSRLTILLNKGDSVNNVDSKVSIFSSKVVDESDDAEALKLIVALKDGKEVECVYIKKDQTVCLSSQVGCALGCLFCSTGKLGFTRNLADYEIIEQFYHILSREKEIKKIVYMGMGEPLLNLNAVLSSLEYFTTEQGISIRNITISTVGIVQGLNQLVKSKLKPKLTLSLHIPNQKRELLIPSAKVNRLEDIKKSLLRYQESSNRRITFAYIMLKGFNLSKSDAKDILNFGQGLIYNVNLIYYNKADDSKFKEPSEEEIKNFESYLKSYKISYSVRHSKGVKINAACGQLALKRAKDTILKDDKQ